jgi:hypothetical protein
VRALLALVPFLCSCAFVCPPDEVRDEPLPALVASAPRGPLEAGASKVDITPDDAVYMGGFGILRTSEGIHDAIWARALALRRGDLTMVILSADLVGLHHHHAEVVRDRLAARATRAAVLVHATHNHDGPDTLGMWGLPPFSSGIDDEYQERALAGLTQAAEEAIAALTPARGTWGQLQAPALGISKNRRQPDLIDRTVSCVAFDRASDGAPIGALVHYACHPEGMGSKNRILSADFPYGIYAEVERARPGSVAVFLNGPLGGMVSTDEADETFEEVERIGRAIGRLALESLAPGTPLPDECELAAASRPVWMPIQNRRFHLGDAFGIFAGRPFDDGYTRTEVQALRIGPITLLTAPGEVLPKLGFQLQGLINARLGLVVSLGNDELGYLVHEEDWEDDRYAYERTVSPGPLAPIVIRRAAREALADVGALAGEPETGR